MSNLWRRMFGPPRTPPQPSVRRALGQGFTSVPYDPMEPPVRPSRRTLAAGAMRGVEVYVHAAHSFWTGAEANRARQRGRGERGRELIVDKIERLVIGNGHMLTAIYHLLDAQVPSEIECPNCKTTIRAPYAEELKKD